MRAKSLAELKNRDSDRDKVLKWLNHIEEHDQNVINEVIEQCAKYPEVRQYYVNRFNLECV